MKRTLMAATMVTILTVGMQFMSAGDDAFASPPEIKMASAPSSIIVDKLSIEAKVTAIDTEKRAVTLEKDGKSKTLICGPGVKNFDQIEVGDLVRSTFLESLAVYIQKAGAPAGGESVETVTLAPKGIMPGVVVTKSMVLNVKIDTVDLKKRTVIVTEPNGTTKTFKVAKTVKILKKLKKGDDVVLRFTEAMAISVDPPKK